MRLDRTAAIVLCTSSRDSGFKRNVDSDNFVDSTADTDAGEVGVEVNKVTRGCQRFLHQEQTKPDFEWTLCVRGIRLGWSSAFE